MKWAGGRANTRLLRGGCLVIELLQRVTHEVVSAMNNSHQQAQGTAGQVLQAVAALQRISGAVSIISSMNLQIASAAEE